jgi:hypothetical protein
MQKVEGSSPFSRFHPLTEPEETLTMKACIVGASGKLARYIVQHALARGYEVVGAAHAASACEGGSLPPAWSAALT